MQKNVVFQKMHLRKFSKETGGVLSDPPVDVGDSDGMENKHCLDIPSEIDKGKAIFITVIYSNTVFDSN